jgi:hypothetical protein
MLQDDPREGIASLARNTAEVYAKSIYRGAEVDRIAGEEIRAAMTRGCAPAIGVHRPFCACRTEQQAGTQEVQ